ncbi:hypothetical protein [Clostridium sp. JS66]|uniref:hypothetical protein n=1 Tax=Clostridium sp. JS66 TaxID=3064705 RepID=UPI00298E9AC7|nr:hypothetical protein [Clostridium sp. JS66]WPC42392.1 hypothetical protein Q6H37_02705 [Clostridium sp. JS66]
MDKLEGIIVNKLKELEIDYYSLKSFIQEYLIKIEEIIFQKEKNRDEAINILKNNRFSVVSISKDLNCSRTTLYNHGAILKKYIELSEIKFIEDNPFELFEKLKTEKQLLENQLNQMIGRDVNNEILANELDTHINTIKEKDDTIKRLEVEKAELSKTNRELKKQIFKNNK